MAIDSVSESRISQGFLTVVPKEVRDLIGAREGDRLQWKLRRGELVVRLRKRVTIDDVTSLGRFGGDAVASKRAGSGLSGRVR
jgi:bifunctional DNA-binding transcriptional regulator/antitoxin component of YhaV-PrlF toxin-antitoxin module